MFQPERVAADNDAISQAFDVIGIFGRSTKSLRTLDLWIKGDPGVHARAKEWLDSDSEYLLFWRVSEGPAAMMFCDSKELLLKETLGQVMKAAEHPKTALLMSLTGTEIDKPAEDAWGARGGLVAQW
ncbi:MAG: hypothetical protein KXJ61_05520 [Hydrogenophaga sp.]|jgi:hypothetical protein|uniref:hypothetical protein n=1 Tax=Hydrogenophaga sp. TaxID=1904254 RepID=UPI001E11EEFD|nr:hypothetical protein [Hydrogenophaga sp.]MBW0169670.1 hypothetical protein [Hydrogenophaga sp.]MBW0183292.1 hypothetical protein [Hydrogenophaga sp.]